VSFLFENVMKIAKKTYFFDTYDKNSAK
jgi:hypothetical protein